MLSWILVLAFGDVFLTSEKRQNISVGSKLGQVVGEWDAGGK